MNRHRKRQKQFQRRLARWARKNHDEYLVRVYNGRLSKGERELRIRGALPTPLELAERIRRIRRGWPPERFEVAAAVDQYRRPVPLRIKRWSAVRADIQYHGVWTQ